VDQLGSGDLPENGQEYVPAAVPPAVDVLAGGPGESVDWSGTVPGRTGGGRRSRTAWVAGLLTVVLVLAGAAGYVAWSKLAGGGPQPEQVLPANTVAMVKLDLDPPAGQKLELFRLLQKFPQAAQLTSADNDFGNWLVRRLSAAADNGVPGFDFATDVRPWLGKRVALAAVPGAAGGVQALVVVQETDDAAATKAMRKLQGLGGGGLGFVVKDGYLVVSPGSPTAAQAAVADAAHAPLASAQPFASDVASLHSDQVVTAWIDQGRAGRLLQQAMPGASPDLNPFAAAGGLFGADASGRVVVGVHAVDSSVELQVRTIGSTPGPVEPALGPPTDLVPGAFAVLAFSGAGDSVGRIIERFAATPGYRQLLAGPDSLGLSLPGDLETLLGSRLTLSVGDGAAGPAFLGASRSADPAAAAAVVRKLLRAAGPDAPHVVMRTTGDTLYVGSSQAAVDGAGGGGLTSTDLYQRAVVDADNAQAVGFVDLSKVWEIGASQGDSVDPELRHLAAVGFSSTSTRTSSSVTLRVVFS
jgi:hypothetical protein